MAEILGEMGEQIIDTDELARQLVEPGEPALAEIRAELFAKPQACMRASSLPKRYGWGVHYDEQGRLALYGVESAEYGRFAAGEAAGVKVVAAMRNRRA